MDTIRVVNFRISRLVLAAMRGARGRVAFGGGKAHDYRVGSLRIDHPWAIATPQGAKVGVGYMKIINEGLQADRLIAITSPAARKVTIHASVKEGDVVKMRPLDKGLEIKPGETVEIEARKARMSCSKTCRLPWSRAAACKVHLLFEKAGSIDVDFTIEPMGTKTPSPSARA